MSKREKFQAKKNYRRARNALTRHAPHVAKVIPVEAPIEKSCDGCKNTFTTNWKYDTLCGSCITLKKFREHISTLLLNDGNQSCTFPALDGEMLYPHLNDGNQSCTFPALDVEMLYPDYLIRIEYSINIMTHCGWCSDHRSEDVRRNTITKTIVCPLFKKFTSKDFNSATNNVTNIALLYAMYNPKDSYGCNCGDGEQNFSIESAIIFKKADTITLDE